MWCKFPLFFFFFFPTIYGIASMVWWWYAKVLGETKFIQRAILAYTIHGRNLLAVFSVAAWLAILIGGADPIGSLDFPPLCSSIEWSWNGLRWNPVMFLPGVLSRLASSLTSHKLK